MGTQRQSVTERFFIRVRMEDSCWLWTGALGGGGYGRFWPSQERSIAAHRYAYELCVGPIPEGLQLDHLCRTPLCVRPSHLEPVTAQVNALRGVGPPARYAKRTHCKRGHPFSIENTTIRKAGWRDCKTCNRERARKHSEMLHVKH